MMNPKQVGIALLFALGCTTTIIRAGELTVTLSGPTQGITLVGAGALG